MKKFKLNLEIGDTFEFKGGKCVVEDILFSQLYETWFIEYSVDDKDESYFLDSQVYEKMGAKINNET